MILLLGGTGFLGKAVCRRLDEQDVPYVATGRRNADLRDMTETMKLFETVRPKSVVHLAATVGGIGANQRYPADFWRDNLLMGINVIHACKLAQGVKRLVFVCTTCAYPKVPPRIPFVEEDLFAGYPEPTNAPYGIAKRTLLVGAWAYRQQYGLDVVTLVPTNLYGIEDLFDLENSHVIPALVRKFHEAKVKGADTVHLWGTGQATRDFLYVDDAAEAIVQALERPPLDGNPINVGSGSEVSIRGLAEEVRGIVGFQGKIDWDATKPDGQPRRCLNIDRAKLVLGWAPKISLHDGLERTYSWWTAATKQ